MMSIQKKINEILNIILELEYLKGDLLSISNTDAFYYKSVTKSSESFTRIYWNSYKLFVIELAKLLDSKEQFCLLSLINYLLSNDKEIIWKRDFDKSKLIEYHNEIKKLESEDFKHIKILRDKFYAHTDKNRNNLLPIPYSFDVGCKLLKRLREIFQDIILHLENRKIMFDLIIPNLTYELILIHRYNKIKELIFEKIKTNSNLEELQEIINILLGKPSNDITSIPD